MAAPRLSGLPLLQSWTWAARAHAFHNKAFWVPPSPLQSELVESHQLAGKAGSWHEKGGTSPPLGPDELLLSYESAQSSFAEVWRVEAVGAILHGSSLVIALLLCVESVQWCEDTGPWAPRLYPAPASIPSPRVSFLCLS